MFEEKLLNPTAPLIVGEVAQAHDGSLGAAHAYIDALADVGADAVKFQTHIADQESTLDEAFRIKFSHQDATRYDYWRRMEFTAEQWAGLKAHADEKGIAFLSTPFSAAAVELLHKLDLPAWKIGSGDVALEELYRPMLATGKPLIVSSGMSGWDELDRLVAALRNRGSEFALMQCTSMYPTPLEEVGVNNLSLISERYGCRVGLSDHSGKTTPAKVAIARGFPLIEVHTIFDKRMFGPDTVASLTIEQIGELVQFARDVVTLNEHPVDKDEKAAQLSQQKSLFGRSVGLRADLSVGHQIAADDLLPKKPGGGIPWADKDALIGRRLVRNAVRNRLLKNEDLN